jgi:ATP-dependent helicase HrpB
VLLQPRRVAARSLARRIASERNWTIGQEVGWQIRFEKRFSRDTGLLVATEGVLVRRLVGDPLLSDISTVVLDEFHERSVHSDLALAFVRQAMFARPDLRVVVMSATLDAATVAGFLDAPVLEIPGGIHQVELEWKPGLPMDAAVRDVIGRSDGDVLCFLPGVREIRKVSERLSGLGADVEIHELHGSLDVERQEAAIVPSVRRKVILATNIAETSLTVEGVSAVIDSGLHRVLRYEPSVGIDRLQTERIPRDAAEQRTGRAGRVGPGLAVRLWDERDELRPHREPEIHRIDLASLILDVMAWGDDAKTMEWFDPPAEARIAEDLRLLEQLGAVRGGRLTPEGRALQNLTVHPRLGRVLLSSSDRSAAAKVCAMISEGERWASGELEQAGLGADLLLLLDRFDRAPKVVRRVARELEVVAQQSGPAAGDESIERAILKGFPDRVARRRDGSSSRLLLSTGRGAVLGGHGSTPDSEYVIALDVRAGDRERQAEALVRLASRMDPAWLEPTHVTTESRLDGDRVRGIETSYYGAIAIGERVVEPDPELAVGLLVDGLRSRGLSEGDERLARRLRLAGIELDFDHLFRVACAGRTTLPRFQLSDWIPRGERSRLERMAPERLRVPSGREVRLDYRENGDVVLAVKLQEMFGAAESPRVGPDRTPVRLELLAPNGRPVQITNDLRSFWETAYQEVRKELRGRYPKHPWPEDPWTAEATAGTRRRS